VPRQDYRSVGTTLSGIEAAVGILEGLRRRDLGLGPQYVATSVWESAMFWQWRDMATMVNIDEPSTAYADLGSRYALYATSDDRVILVCPIERRFWEAFCDLLELPAAWKNEGSWDASGMDWGKGRTDERRLIAERMRTRPLSEWLTRLEAAGIPFSPLLNIKEAATTAHAEAVGVMAAMTVNGTKVYVPNVPLHITSPGGSAEYRGPTEAPPPPKLGADTQAFLRRIP
jgi:crotonobetainyl-CoA:carnitine CoA-transferase CaiB-like acyl-CoA transferase